MDTVQLLDTLQDAVIKSNENKIKKPQYNFDKLKMYFAEDFSHKGIIIKQPTIGDILEIGEESFYQALSPFLYNSTSIRVFLWDNGIDWNKVKDIEVFAYLIGSIQNKKPLEKMFNISFDDFRLLKIQNEENDKDFKFVLCSESQKVLIHEEDYMIIAEYLRELFNRHPKVEKAKGKTAKVWMIQEEKMNAQQRETKENHSLLPLVSSCVNHPGFKYKLQELREMGIYQFMDSVSRIYKYEKGTAALKGIYSGFCSAKDIGGDTLDFMGDL